MGTEWWLVVGLAISTIMSSFGDVLRRWARWLTYCVHVTVIFLVVISVPWPTYLIWIGASVVLYVLSSALISSILPHLLARPWSKLPRAFVDAVKGRLGDQGFSQLACLSRQYGLLEQDFFGSLRVLAGDVDLNVDELAMLVCSMGNALAHRGLMDDAEVALTLALKLKPDHWPCHGSLAQLYADTGRLAEAARSARVALVGLSQIEDELGSMAANGIELTDHPFAQNEEVRETLRESLEQIVAAARSDFRRC